MNDTKEERKGWLKGRGKLFNFRPVLAISSGFGLGIFLCYAFSLHALWIGLLLAVGGGGAICLFLRKKEKSALPALLFAAFLLLMFCLGALSFSARLSSYNADNAAEGTYTVSATVKDIAGKNSLYLTDAMLTDGDSVRALGGNIRVYVNSLPDEIGIGTKVSFECELKPYDSSAYGRFNVTPILENTKYMASVSGDKIMVRGEKKFDLFYAARERLRNVLFGTMREEEAAVCYAMLTGRRQRRRKRAFAKFPIRRGGAYFRRVGIAYRSHLCDFVFSVETYSHAQTFAVRVDIRASIVLRRRLPFFAFFGTRARHVHGTHVL